MQMGKKINEEKSRRLHPNKNCQNACEFFLINPVNSCYYLQDLLKYERNTLA